MIDTINPMNFDLTKNLHGHVRVETRDRWTGRVIDSQEKDNLVTNALQKFVSACAWIVSGTGATAMSAELLPFYSKALGGLFLFSGTLTESASNIGFPSNVNLVGFAAQSTDSSSTLKGNLNPSESVFTSTGFTTTWDFLTSQANGTIASLARSSWAVGGLTSTQGFDCFMPSSFVFTYGSDTTTTPTSNVVYLGYDSTNKYLYLGLSSAATIGGVTYPTSNIYRVKADFDNVSLLQSYLPPASRWTLVKSLTSSDGSASSTAFVYDEYENNFIYANGTTLHIVAMDGTHTTKTLTGTSGNLRATENYYWRASGDTVYCIDKTNVSNVETTTYSGTIVNIIPYNNDIVFVVGGNSYNYMPTKLLYPNGTIIDFGYPAKNNGDNFRLVGRFYTNGTTLKLPSFYLGTIANLDSPVTKTSSQTMKITYTLTEA